MSNEPPPVPSPEAPSEGADPAPVEPSEARSDAPEQAIPPEATGEPEAQADAPEATADAAEAKTAPKAAKRPQWKPPPVERLDAVVEALLLVAGDVLKYDRLRDLLGVPSRAPVRESIDRIKARWEDVGLAVELEEVAGGVRVVTRPEYAEYVGRMVRRPQSDKLSRSLLETLSIIAYKQPVGRAEVERIRGVQAGEAIRALLERRLAKVLGRSDQPGRPLLYGTTDRFLTSFGLQSLKDLPKDGDLKRL